MQAGFIAERARGYVQITGPVTATSLAPIPDGTSLVLIRAEGAGLRWRCDGVAPTAAIGYPLEVGEELELTTAQLAAFLFIQRTPTAILNVNFFG